VLDRVKAGTLGKHPAGEDALLLAGQLDLIDLDEGGGIWRFGRRTGVAHARRHLERAELDGLVDGDFEMRDAPRDLVEGGEHGRLILDLLGLRRPRRQPGSHGRSQQQQRKPGTGRLDHGHFHLLHDAAHLLNGPQTIPPVRSLAIKTRRP
jgi:hypothetical protein